LTQTGDTNKESKLLEGDYKFLFDNSPISIALLDLKGNIVEINPATHSMMALKRSQIIGKHFSDIYIIPPENLDEMISAFKDILDGRIYGPKEIRIFGKDNKITWVNVTGSLVKIKNTPFIQILTQDVSSRKELENKLEESELRYRRLYENSPFSLVLLNRKGIIINCNSTTEKIYGYKKEEVIGKDFLVLNIYSDEQIKLLIKRYKELREGKTLKPLELQIKRKDGTLIWVSQLTTLNKVGGEILIETITQDISERKIAEQKLSESEEKYRIFTENSNDLIVVVDSKLKTKFINEGVHTRLMGYRRDDVIGKNGLDFIHPDDQEEVFEAFSKLRDEGSGSVESRIKHKKGHYIWTETTGSMFKGKDNKLNFILNARIIEERKKAEQTLKESRKRYIELANSLPEVIFEIDLNYRLTYTNSIASEVFGYSNEDFKKGLYAHQFLHPDEKEEVFDNLAKLFTGKRVAPQIMRLRRKDESYFYANVITIPTYENGKVVGIRSIIHDVTEIKEAQEKIKESEEQFRTIAEQSLMGICIIQDNVVKYLNKTLADLLGFAVEDIHHDAPGTNPMCAVTPLED